MGAEEKKEFRLNCIVIIIVIVLVIFQSNIVQSNIGILGSREEERIQVELNSIVIIIVIVIVIFLSNVGILGRKERIQVELY